MAGKPLYSPEVRSHALDLYQHEGLAKAAKETGVSKGRIHSWAKEAGIKSEAITERTTRLAQAANEARLVQMAERRTKLADDLLTDAERLRVQLWEPATVHHWGTESERDGNIVTTRTVFMEHEIERPVFADQKAILGAVATAVDRHYKLLGEDAEVRRTGDTNVQINVLPAGDDQYKAVATILHTHVPAFRQRVGEAGGEREYRPEEDD